VTEKEIEEGEAQSDRAERYSLERPSNGGAQNYACATRYVVNRSSRGGVRPTMFVLHYTVSGNRPGTGDLDAIRGLFNSPSFGASSTYGIDFEGNCQQWVPESQKPWTQGAQNPRSISVEIIATGRESRAQWLASPLIRNGRLAALARDSMRRNGIPLTRVDPVGCGAPAGWTDHDSLECGNSHTDVRPSFPFDVFARQLRAGVNAPSKVETWCRKVRYYRALPKRSKTTAKRRLAEERVKLAAKAGYVCGPTGPVKR
jgi:N-acetyl-anhydromuramyl-L-alanine amidase AmpD